MLKIASVLMGMLSFVLYDPRSPFASSPPASKKYHPSSSPFPPVRLQTSIDSVIDSYRHCNVASCHCLETPQSLFRSDGFSMSISSNTYNNIKKWPYHSDDYLQYLSWYPIQHFGHLSQAPGRWQEQPRVGVCRGREGSMPTEPSAAPSMRDFGLLLWTSAPGVQGR